MAERVHDDYLRSRAAMDLDAEARAAQEQGEQARQEAARQALTPTGIVGRVGTQFGREVTVERTPTAVVIRHPSAAINRGVLAALSDDQAGQLAEELTEAIHPDKLNKPQLYGTVAHVATLPTGTRRCEVAVERNATGTAIRDMAALYNRGTALVQINSDQTGELVDILERALGR